MPNTRDDFHHERHLDYISPVGNGPKKSIEDYRLECRAGLIDSIIFSANKLQDLNDRQPWIDIYDSLDQLSELDEVINNRLDRYPTDMCELHGNDARACYEHSQTCCCEPTFQYINITKIVVPTEYDKEQLLRGFEYIHNLREIDTDFKAVNTICHVYENPDLIEVKN